MSFEAVLNDAFYLTNYVSLQCYWYTEYKTACKPGILHSYCD